VPGLNNMIRANCARCCSPLWGCLMSEVEPIFENGGSAILMSAAAFSPRCSISFCLPCKSGRAERGRNPALPGDHLQQRHSRRADGLRDCLRSWGRLSKGKMISTPPNRPRLGSCRRDIRCNIERPAGGWGARWRRDRAGLLLLRSLFSARPPEREYPEQEYYDE
jgi:hypothetical protein